MATLNAVLSARQRMKCVRLFSWTVLATVTFTGCTAEGAGEVGQEKRPSLGPKETWSAIAQDPVRPQCFVDGHGGTDGRVEIVILAVPVLPGSGDPSVSCDAPDEGGEVWVLLFGTLCTLGAGFEECEKGARELVNTSIAVEGRALENPSTSVVLTDAFEVAIPRSLGGTGKPARVRAVEHWVQMSSAPSGLEATSTLGPVEWKVRAKVQ